MTSLMQKIIDGNMHYGSTPTDIGVGQATREYTVARLNPNVKTIKWQEGPPHISERYLFADTDPQNGVADAVADGQLTYAAVFRQARMPVDSAWIEWKMSDPDRELPPSQMGILIDTSPVWPALSKVLWKQEAKNVMQVYLAHANGPTAILAMIICFTTDIGGTDNYHYFVPYYHTPKDPDMDCKETADLILQDIMSLLFLITLPRATEIVRQDWSPALQKARRRRGKGPLLEYRKVTLLVGSTRRVHLPGHPTGPATPRRLHQVVGHYRTYLQGRNEPHVTWVPQHWRGDPKLGIVMHDRTVKIPKASL